MIDEKKILPIILVLLIFSRKAAAKPVKENSNFSPGFSFEGVSFPAGLARGMKINNPGNLREFGENWQGRVVPSRDSAFITFATYQYGLRAMIKLLQNYIKGGYNTISKILNRYAPSSENDTKAYIDYIARMTNIDKDQVLTGDFSQMKKIVKHMANLEQGVDARTDEFFNQAWAML